MPITPLHFAQTDVWFPGIHSLVQAGAVVILFFGIFLLFSIIPYWILFTRAGKPGWATLIPFYNIWVYCTIAGRRPIIHLFAFVGLFIASMIVPIGIEFLTLFLSFGILGALSSWAIGIMMTLLAAIISWDFATVYRAHPVVALIYVLAPLVGVWFLVLGDHPYQGPFFNLHGRVLTSTTWLIDGNRVYPVHNLYEQAAGVGYLVAPGVAYPGAAPAGAAGTPPSDGFGQPVPPPATPQAMSSPWAPHPGAHSTYNPHGTHDQARSSQQGDWTGGAILDSQPVAPPVRKPAPPTPGLEPLPSLAPDPPDHSPSNTDIGLPRFDPSA